MNGCTGVRPIRFSAKNLPATLRLDPATGIVSGTAPAQKGEYAVEFMAVNAAGTATRALRIIVGDRLGLTPQMGWNDWYTHIEHVTDANIRTAAETMISSGMADYGYQFISIDDGWSTFPGSKDALLNGPARDASGGILPNGKFPDMKALTAFIHARRLRAGIYSSPGPTTCANFLGSSKHEADDARQFAAWGFDLLKYDWCSYDAVSGGRSMEQMQHPYIEMGKLLRRQNRDMVFNLCQYGMGRVWEWGAQVGGNSWRTTDDVGILVDTSLPSFYSGGIANAALDKNACPGGWNDPDYIMIGKVASPKDYSAPAIKTPLTADEQYSYMSMWSLMASPLFFAGDMANLDPFTLNILCNSEVIDVDQDALGKQGHIVRKTAEEFVLAKPLEDGTVAVGLFNLSKTPRTVGISWSELQMTGSHEVRDLWRQKNLGKFTDRYEVAVPSHGVAMIRISNAQGKLLVR